MTARSRVTGTDGKSYPTRPLALDARQFFIGRCHYLAHVEHLSVRAIAARLAAEHGVTRSVGSVQSYLADHRCERCPVQVRRTGTPEQQAVPQ